MYLTRQNVGNDKGDAPGYVEARPAAKPKWCNVFILAEGHLHRSLG